MAILRPILRPVMGSVLRGLMARWGSDVLAPTLVSIEVGNVADNKIVATMNELMDTGSVAATSDFVVYGTSETVSSVAVAGKTWTLTMSGVIWETDTIFISYTAGANPIQDAAGNAAANLVTQYVANHTTIYLRDEDGTLITDEDLNPIPIGGKRIDITDGGGDAPEYVP